MSSVEEELGQSVLLMELIGLNLIVIKQMKSPGLKKINSAPVHCRN
jgi:hypothetical protein